jgi:predicted GIY-YIG superfamily endonuclease
MTSWIYIIHLDQPHFHAQHYVGCTAALQQRLTTHAIGDGSNFLRTIRDNGIHWQLASLYQTSHANMRRLERQIKDCSAGPRFCNICNPIIPRIKGCVQYDIRNLPFPVDSRGLLAARPNGLPENRVRFSNENDSDQLPTWLRSVQRPDKDALGFIPAGGRREAGLDRLIPLGKIIIATSGKAKVGFLAFTLNQSGTRLTIHQCVVLDHARFAGHGRRMIDLLRSSYDDIEFSCHVRADLAANVFWQKCGFILVGSKTHKTSGSVLNHYIQSPTYVTNGDK